MTSGESEEPLEQKIDPINGETIETVVQTTSTPASIATYIRQRITDGEYKPFQRLRKNELANELGVNISTITTIFKMLRDEGLIFGNNNNVYVYGGPNSTENSITELHQIIAYKLRKRLENGLYKPGDRIPSVDDLVNDNEIGGSRVTVLRGIGVLTQEGLLVSKRGRGVFVNPNYANASTQYCK